MFFFFFAVLALVPGRAYASSARPGASVPPDPIQLDMVYAGVGPEGIDRVWRGRALGPLAGEATLRVEYLGAPGDGAMARRPVSGVLLFAADDYRASFAADLSGSLDRRTGVLRLTGVVTDGAFAPAVVRQTVQLHGPGGDGVTEIRFSAPHRPSVTTEPPPEP